MLKSIVMVNVERKKILKYFEDKTLFKKKEKEKKRSKENLFLEVT